MPKSIKGMMPADATPFVGKNREDVAVTFDKPGAYGVKCMPHYGMGMVALIVVGTPGNLAEAKAVPQVGKAKQVFAALFDKLADEGRRSEVRLSDGKRSSCGGGLAPSHLSGLAAAWRTAFARSSCSARSMPGLRYWSGCRCFTAS